MSVGSFDLLAAAIGVADARADETAEPREGTAL